MSRAHDPQRGEIYQAPKNLEVLVLAVWPKRVDVAVVIAGERSRPIPLTKATFERLFFGPVRLATAAEEGACLADRR